MKREGGRGGWLGSACCGVEGELGITPGHLMPLSVLLQALLSRCCVDSLPRWLDVSESG